MSQSSTAHPGEISPGRLYRQEDLSYLLPATLRRIVIARLRPIGEVYLGQAIIEVLAKEYLSEAAPPSSLSMKSDTMTLIEVAEYLRVSERTVRRMVERGQITAEDHREPGTHKALLRFSRAQLDKDRKKAATQEEQPPVKSKFRL